MRASEVRVRGSEALELRRRSPARALAWDILDDASERTAQAGERELQQLDGLGRAGGGRRGSTGGVGFEGGESVSTRPADVSSPSRNCQRWPSAPRMSTIGV